MKNPKPSSKTSSQGEEPRRLKLRLSSAAEAELEAIDAFSFEQFGDEVASVYMRRFYELFDLLRRHPLAGQAAPDLGRGLRSLSHRSHRILYQASKNEVLIVRVLHHAVDMKRALSGTAK
jgi:toxin ParE1/3/4